MTPARPLPFRTVLVANRGEIAVRVIRTLRALGLRSVAIHSDADRDALHVREADAAERVGPPPPRESYLSVEAVLASGRHCLLVIDVQGVATLRSAGTPATYVLLEPPSRAELERRLKTRGSDDPASQARRLDEAERELARAALFDHRVVNADLEAAAQEVAATVGLALAPPPGPGR